MDTSALYLSLNKIKMLVILHLGSTFIVDIKSALLEIRDVIYNMMSTYVLVQIVYGPSSQINKS